MISVDQALGQLLHFQQRAFALITERRMERDAGDPTRIQIFVLRTLSDRGALSVSELAEILSVSVPAASQLINTLVERGWLQMNISPKDRRRHDVQITTGGQRVLNEGLIGRLHRVKRILEKLTPEERTTLVTLLDRVVTLWQADRVHEGSSLDGDCKD